MNCLVPANPETENRLPVAGQMEDVVSSNGYGISFWSNESVLKLESGDVAQFCDYILSRVNFVVYEYLKTTIKNRPRQNNSIFKI